MTEKSKNRKAGWLLLGLANSQWNKCHAPVKKGKNYCALGTGKRWLVRRRQAVLEVLTTHIAINISCSRLHRNAEAPFSLTFQYSKRWTLASVSKSFQELRGKQSFLSSFQSILKKSLSFFSTRKQVSEGRKARKWRLQRWRLIAI